MNMKELSPKIITNLVHFHEQNCSLNFINVSLKSRNQKMSKQFNVLFFFCLYNKENQQTNGQLLEAIVIVSLFLYLSSYFE